MRLLLWLWAAWRFLFSGWTTPNTVTTGAPISASDYNTYQRDNQTYLFSQRPITYLCYSGAADKTTTSTSFVAVDTTNMRLTATINSGRCMIFVNCEWHSAAFTDKIYADILLDGGSTRATNGGTNGVCAWYNTNTNSDRCAFTALFTGLSVGSHTFDLAWKVSTGTGTIRNNGIPVTMTLIEV